MKKKSKRSITSLLLLVALLMANLVPAQAVQIEPRYTGITGLSTVLTISASGGAKCGGEVIALSGYTADLTVELKQDGTTIKTWTASGTGVVSAGSTYYVKSGHDYVVTTSVEVYTSSNTLVCTASKDSPESSY